MKYVQGKVTDIKIAYIGGGSRGWAWGLMSDLAAEGAMQGTVYLYDIDAEAARRNESIGNNIKSLSECKSPWMYKATQSMEEALTDADFVVISIMPGTFDEMESDVHAPEAYGIYQSVGDTVGPGGIVRSLRVIPMFEEFADAIRKHCPKAWVINYTNPMTVCVRTLYRVFPQIKAFGCCHEVFGTQTLLANMLEEMMGINDARREDIKVNVVGVNHFTWLTKANYKGMDLFPVYKEFAFKYKDSGLCKPADENWFNKYFKSKEKVKFDLFLKYGAIAAAGDRHLAEFCPGSWYLKDEEMAERWGFSLTPVSWRKEDLKNRLEKSSRLFKGEEEFKINATGEEGVQQMKALLGLRDLVTNVNLPNYGQIPNLPLGAVVETNACFRTDEVSPVFAGNVPDTVYPLVGKICGEQEMIAAAGLKRDLSMAFHAFIADPNVCISLDEARKLFDIMIYNTKKYLSMY